MASQLSISSTFPLPRLRPNSRIRRGKSGFRCRSSVDGKEEYYIDAEESIGDGFSFSGGKYSDGPSRSDEWFARGKMVKAHPIYSSKGKAKDPIFGLTMGASSQSSADVFRWFCVEAGITSNPSVLLIHGFPSQVLDSQISLSQNMGLTILWMSLYHLWNHLLKSSLQISFPLLCRVILLL